MNNRQIEIVINKYNYFDSYLQTKEPSPKYVHFIQKRYVDYILSTVKFHITLSLFFETSYSNTNMIKVLSPRYKVENFCSFEDPEKLLFFYFQKQN